MILKVIENILGQYLELLEADVHSFSAPSFGIILPVNARWL